MPPDRDDASPDASAKRPAVSVVVPFAGDAAHARAMVQALSPLARAAGDEILLADNTPDAILAGQSLPPGMRAVPAPGEGSPARARNAGALAAANEWLLFVDSDCRPAADLLDAFFAEPVDERCAVVAGRIHADGGQSEPVARYQAQRGFLEQERTLAHPFRPYALTANALVRRAAWRELGGYLEGIRNAEDVDFCWRAQQAGWSVEHRPGAVVEHLHRTTVRGLWRQAAIASASAVWVHRRWPDAPIPPTGAAPALLRAALGAPAFALTGRVERARFKLYDAVVALATVAGRRRSNRAAGRPATEPATRVAVQLWCDEFPVLSETFVVSEARELARLGHDVEVVARRRPQHPALGVHDVRLRYLEDETRIERARALARVLARHPLGCAIDALARRRWRRDEHPSPLRQLAPSLAAVQARPEVVLHAHFAKGAALDAMRIARLASRPWSLTAHAWDIYKETSNLREKVRRADFVTSGCEYTVRDLRAIAGPRRAGRVHEVVMGIDPERFRRTGPQPGGRRVLAVGRLVEKKGFVHLVRAAADDALRGIVDEIVIAGDGPLRGELEAEADRLGVAAVVRFAGRAEPEEIRALLESADVLAMPCVVASDGDRDSMPVVVKEAMAMELPVVVSDEVGLPELVRPAFGRIVPPGDPAALAQALAELLALGPGSRAAMGRAAREHVVAHANVRRETARLSGLLADAIAARAG